MAICLNRVFESRCVFRLFLANKRRLNTTHSENDKNFNSPHFKHPYKRLYPWRSFTEFVDTLQENIVYNDGHLIGICKPFGVGIHKPNVTINKQNKYLSMSKVIGNPQYCIDQALDSLAKRLNLHGLKVVKAVDRFMSGIMLLAADQQTEQRVLQSFRRVKSMKRQYLTCLCITKGYPIINGPYLQEKLGINLVEIDEFGDYKEPKIIVNPSKNAIQDKKVKPVNCELIIKAINKNISASLLQVSVDSHKWQFVRAYISSKTSFILGDIRFSQRVRQVLGVPIQISPYNIGYNDDYEPLPNAIRDKLYVESNRSIPLMLHQQAITLPLYKEKQDLIIQSKKLPKHFLWTLERLNLHTMS